MPFGSEWACGVSLAALGARFLLMREGMERA